MTDARVAELLSLPRSGPQALLVGELASFADGEMFGLMLDTVPSGVDNATRNRIVRALRLSFWTGLHESGGLYLSRCEREQYERALLRAEDTAGDVVTDGASLAAWEIGLDTAERLLVASPRHAAAA